MMRSSKQQISQEVEGDIYESISSDPDLHDSTTKLESSPQVPSSLQQTPSTAIIFPQQPPHLSKLFKIYSKNRSKLAQLRSELSLLQNQILEELRIKHTKVQHDICIQGIEEIDLYDELIEQYDQRRKKREQKLQKQQGIYEFLKKINKMVDFLMKEENVNKMLTRIKKTKEIVNYKATGNQLVILIKCLKHEGKQKQKEVPIEESGVFLAEDNVSEVEYYTVAVFNLDNLFHWLTPKTVNIQFMGQKTFEQLQLTKQSAQMYAQIALKINIKGAHHLVMASYSETQQIVIAHEENGRVILANKRGQIINEVILDQSDRLVLAETWKEKLVLGTHQGVVRIYRIKEKGTVLQLERIVMCNVLQLFQVKWFKLIGGNDLQKIQFFISPSLYEYDLKSNMITQKTKIAQSETQSLGQVFFQLLSLQDKQRERLTAAIKSQLLEQQSKDKQLLYLFVNVKEGTQGSNYLLLGDSEGSLQLRPLNLK